MNFTSKYSGPLAAGLVLFAASCVWAWFYWDALIDRERHQDLRAAVSMAAVIAPLFDPEVSELNGGEEAVGRLVEKRLELRPPIIYAILVSGDRSLASVGRIPKEISDPMEPGLAADGHTFIVRAPVGRRSPPEPKGHEGNRDNPPPPGPPPPDDGRDAPPQSSLVNWEWLAGEPLHPVSLVVGINTALAPRIFRKNIPEIAFALAVGWAGIAAIVLAWYRSIRSRDLARALDAERQERNRLEELNLAAAGLAHETKNPLGIILGLAQRIERGSGDAPEIRDAAGHIIDAADRATARISDFLGFARVRKPNIQSTDAGELLPRLAEALKSDFDDAGVRLEVAAPKLYMQCDPGMLEQVVVNLLLNSLNASVKGSVVSVILERQGGSAVLTIKDHGRGIPPELLPDLFKPYVTGSADGHGLGLAIVKRIADEHGWAIGVESTVGFGTRVTISGIAISKVGGPAE
jgi:signal transduction histidine kinase